MRFVSAFVRTPFVVVALACTGAGAAAQDLSQPPSPQDRSAYEQVAQAVAGMGDVHSVVVLQRGRLAYEFHRDPAAAEPRSVESVDKSAVATLVGIAIGQGRIASVNQPVVALMPEWADANADPRTGAITVRHLLTMTSGFEPSPAPMPAREAWARPLAAAPGQRFAYDNAMVSVLSALLAKATGTPVVDYARRELAEPLGVGGFDSQKGLRLRTIDMARLGQLYLQKGEWQGRRIVPESFVLAATQPQSAGGPPVSFPYGFGWWVIPSKLERQTFMASGFGGQLIWVYSPLELVVAINSTVSKESNDRGQAIQLVRGPIFAAAQKRAAAP